MAKAKADAAKDQVNKFLTAMTGKKPKDMISSKDDKKKKKKKMKKIGRKI